MKLICISDTHRRLGFDIPEGDVLVHAGDIGCEDTARGLVELSAKISDSKVERAVVIPGNHDFWIRENPEEAKLIVPGINLLIDESVTIDGLKFYGSPWQPEFFGWAWNLPRGDALAKVWKKIPDDTNVLITHGPPMRILDYIERQMQHVGCWDLRQRIHYLKELKLHVFGHIHCGYGQEKIDGVEYVNASMCNERYRSVNLPIVVEI